MRPFTLAIMGLLCASAVACSGVSDRDAAVPIEGTTARIGPSQMKDGSDVNLEIFTSRRRCEQVFPKQDNFDQTFSSHLDRINACVPKIDRRTGEVQLSFRVSAPDNMNQRYLLPLTAESVRVAHMEQEAPYVQITPHEPTRSGQLFILVIDHSGSMNEKDGLETTRMERLSKALWAARKSFFAEGSRVALLRFTDRIAGLDGTSWKDVKPVSSEEQFYDQLAYLGGDSGYTHLFKAVKQVMGPVLSTDTAIARAVRQHELAPTVIALTDGFNNIKAQDTCGDNARRLSEALKAIQASQRRPLAQKPTLYTVGFGKGFRPAFKPPKDQLNVSPAALCGKYADYYIDQGLELTHIDNVSLQWMAQIGGGRAFIRSNRRALAEAFKNTAPTRYHWYQAKYRVDPFYLRTQFTARLRLIEHARGESHVEIFPSAWMDAPAAAKVEGWGQPTTARWTAVLLAPALGLLIFLLYLGPATFNARRALTRRAKKTSRSK